MYVCNKVTLYQLTYHGITSSLKYHSVMGFLELYRIQYQQIQCTNIFKIFLWICVVCV